MFRITVANLGVLTQGCFNRVRRSENMTSVSRSWYAASCKSSFARVSTEKRRTSRNKFSSLLFIEARQIGLYFALRSYRASEADKCML